MNKEKLEIIHSWVSANVEEPCEISPASNDASFRSYWRLSFDNDTKMPVSYTHLTLPTKA